LVFFVVALPVPFYFGLPAMIDKPTRRHAIITPRGLDGVERSHNLAQRFLRFFVEKDGGYPAG
jgi:hypothetical protein